MTGMSYLCGAALCLCASGMAAQKTTVAARKSASAGRLVLGVQDSTFHVYRDDGGGIADSLRIVITDSASFADFWRRLVLVRDPSRSAPIIDFATQDLIVAALGAWYAEGPLISIDTVRVQADVRVVVVRRTLPKKDCLDFTQAYYAGRPVDVVVVPRENARATRFVERVIRLKNCGDVDRTAEATMAFGRLFDVRRNRPRERGGIDTNVRGIRGL